MHAQRLEKKMNNSLLPDKIISYSGCNWGIGALYQVPCGSACLTLGQVGWREQWEWKVAGEEERGCPGRCQSEIDEI